MKKRSGILIHHHSIAFVDNERIWIQSFIGSWIQELSVYFDEIGLLILVSNSRRDEQDYPVTAKNVKVHRLNPSYNCNRFERNQHYRQVCREVSPDYGSLLIRGITPRQKLVFDNCDTARKYFLLVGSLIDSRPSLRLNKSSLVKWFLFRLRMHELKRISRYATMFANSPAVVQEVTDVLGVHASFMPTNTISRNDFMPLIVRDIKQPVRILFCGRVVKEKGIEELIDAIGALIENNVRITLNVIGSITNEYRTILSEKIAKMGLETQISFKGYIKLGPDLFKYYCESDFYVLPSWHEGFPHSIWEAAVTCTPVIVTSVGGIPGIVNSDHVLFCKVRNSGSIADTIIECITNSNGSKSRCIALYKLAANYTVEKCAEITYGLISETSS